MPEGRLDGLLLWCYWYLVHKLLGRILGCNEMFTSLYHFIHLLLNYRSVWSGIRHSNTEQNSAVCSSCVRPETRMLKIGRWPVGTEQRHVMVFACFVHLVQISDLTASLLVGAILGFLRVWYRFGHCCAFSVVLCFVLRFDCNRCMASAVLLTASLLKPYEVYICSFPFLLS